MLQNSSNNVWTPHPLGWGTKFDKYKCFVREKYKKLVKLRSSHTLINRLLYFTFVLKLTFCTKAAKDALFYLYVSSTYSC